MKPCYLSVIIPAYNEATNFARGALDPVIEYLSQQAFSWEVIIVDDGSTDGSVEQLQQFSLQHTSVVCIQNPHMGKAGTVATGVNRAQGKYILFTDFDQATPLKEWEKLHPYLLQDYDIVIGSREVAGSRRDQEPLYRHIMGRGFNWGVQLLAVRGIRDTQCGFKAFKGTVAKKIFDRLQVYKPKEISAAFTGAFDVEILFIANKLGLDVAEVPIEWAHVETDRVSPLRDSMLMALDVVKIRFYDILGRYSA